VIPCLDPDFDGKSKKKNAMKILEADWKAEIF